MMRSCLNKRKKPKHNISKKGGDQFGTVQVIYGDPTATFSYLFLVTAPLPPLNPCQLRLMPPSFFTKLCDPLHNPPVLIWIID